MILKKEEQLALSLRERYERCGYRLFKMSKFEEYDFYIRNKEALTGSGIITFTDTTGKLMALKPDVTLSIIKHARDTVGAVQKVYYNENVYRVSPSAHCFKEIPQTGLECMGDIDLTSVYEVVRLALDSLAAVSKDAVLDISHLGLLSELLAPVDSALQSEICRLLSQKNSHELSAVCTAAGLSQKLTDTLCKLTTLYGTPAQVLPQLEALLAPSKALQELKNLTDLLPQEQLLHIDPSVTDDMNYYNGFVFKGFVRGVPEHILSGGQYDKLMHRMGHSGGAIGFALYPDRLERMEEAEAPVDADILLLYDDKADIKALMQAAEALRQEGSVMLQKVCPHGLRFHKILHFSEGRVCEK